MKRFVHVLLATSLLATLFCAPVRAADDEEGVTTSTLRGPLHLMQGRGGNVIASVGLDGLLLVDNDYSDLGGAYEKALEALSGTMIAPGFIVNTHWHGDHTGNNEFWGNRGSVMVAHDNVRERMSSAQKIEALDMEVAASPAIALPIVTFSDSLVLHFNGSDIEVQHYPKGHTDGDSVVFYTGENVVHMGDLFFNGGFPFVDLSSGGSVAGYIANVENVLSRTDAETLIVPGHGAVASREDLVDYLAMLKTTTADIRAALAKGKSTDDIVSAGLGEQWASWGKGFINEAQWIQTVAADGP